MLTKQPELLRFIRRLAQPDNRQHTDQELIGRFLARRDEASFLMIVHRYGSMVYAVCRRVLGDEANSEDAFQESFLVLARKAGTLRTRASLADWLYGVARRTALQARAKAARRAARERSAPTRAVCDTLAEVSVRETLAILDEELARLPEKYRVPLLLCTLEGLSRDEAARQLNWSLNALKSRLEQGRVLLRRRLAGRGLALPAALFSATVLGGVSRASPPAALVDGATRAAIAAMGPSTGDVSVSAKAISLMKGVKKVMWMGKGKLMLGLAVVVTAAGFGVGVPAFRQLGAETSAKAIAPAAPPGAVSDPDAAAANTVRAALEKALEGAAALDDPFQKARGLILVARAQNRVGDRKAAAETARLALKAADGVPTNEEESGQAKCVLLMMAAEAQAEAGEIQAARETARRIKPDDFVQSVQVTGTRGAAERAVAAALAKAGKFDEAIKTAGAIRDRWQKGYALGDVAADQAEKGDWTAARKTAESIEYGDARVKALAALARLRAKAGAKSEADELFAAAIRMVAGFDNGEGAVGDRAFALTGVVHEQAESGDLKAALKTAESIPEFVGFPFKEVVLVDIRARGGDVDGALKAARTLPDGLRAAEGLKIVAEAQARAKDFGPALRTVDRIRDDFTKAAALVVVAREQVRAGDRKEGAGTFDKALKAAAGLTEGKYRFDEHSRQFLLRTLAAAQAEVGEEDAARAWIAKELSGYVRTFALVGLAEGTAQHREAGDRPGGR